MLSTLTSDHKRKMTPVIWLILIFGTLVHSDPHIEVLEWWNQMSVQKPLKCKLNPELLEDFHPIANKFLKEEMRTKLIETRLCQKDEVKTYKTKNLAIVNGTFHGTGKILFKNWNQHEIDEQWRTQQNDQESICVNRGYFNNMAPTEVVGTFKNGLLDGQVKLKFSDNSSVIATFENGSQKGLLRNWNFGDLTQMSFKDLKPKGFTWLRDNNYLIYQYSNFISEDEEILSVAIPMNTSDEILVGTYNNALGILENVHSAEIQVKSKEYCMLNLIWKPTGKKPFKYFFGSDLKIPILYQNEPNCKGNDAHKKTSTEEQYLAWNNYMMGFQRVAHNGASTNVLRFKPELSPVDSTATPLINDLIIGSDNVALYANFSTWNGPIQKWKIVTGTLDKNGDLHGFVNLGLYTSDIGKAGSPDFLDWSPKNIYAKFHHGVPNGLVFIMTSKGQGIFTFLKNGILHGPVYVYGQISVMNMEVRFQNFNDSALTFKFC